MNTNDTINITGSDDGVKKINIMENQASNIKFNKTVNFKNTSTLLELNFPYMKDSESQNYTLENNGRVYIKKGNNLVVAKADSNYNGVVPEIEANPDIKYTIKNYFLNKNNRGEYLLENNIKINTPDGTQTLVTKDLSDDINDFKLLQVGNTKKATKFYDTYYNDVIIGGYQNDVYNISEGGDDLIFDAKGNDSYKVNNIVDTLSIDDRKGKDSLTIKNADNIGVFFNVSVDGEKIVTGENLQIFDTTQIKTNDDNSNEIVGGITIKNYLTTNASKDKGCIETIKFGSNKMNLNIGSIANSVAGWLNSNGYTSSADVFVEQKQEGDLNQLIALYTE